MPAAREWAPIGPDEAERLFACLKSFPHVALAVSGGRDSMALARLAARWAAARPGRPRLTALIVDHGLRAGSHGDAEAAGAWCAEAGLPHRILIWEGEKPRTRIEERARQARYDLLLGWCRAHGVAALALAHHLDDQSETVLMRLARSSGVDGLAAMRERTERAGIAILRPFLSVPRARLEATLADFGQAWIDDPANADTAVERVRLRAAQPALASLGLRASAITESARKLARAAEALACIADERFAAIASIDPAGFATLDRAALAREPAEIAIRVLARTLAVVGAGTRISSAPLERIARALIDGAPASATLARCRLVTQGQDVLVVREQRALPRQTLAPGIETVWDRRFMVATAASAPEVEIAALGRSGFAEACGRDRRLEAVPSLAGMALPGGFRDGALSLLPQFGPPAPGTPFAVQFVHQSGVMNDATRFPDRGWNRPSSALS